MSEYKPQASEVIFLEEIGSYEVGRKASGDCEIVLSNIHLIIDDLDTRRRFKFLLSDLKRFNNQPQVRETSDICLQMYFGKEKVILGISPKKTCKKWSKAIVQAALGKGVNESLLDNMSIPGSEFVAKTLKDTVGTFAQTFGIKVKERESNEMIAKKCTSCSAPISGMKGQVVRCQYCGSDQQL